MASHSTKTVQPGQAGTSEVHSAFRMSQTNTQKVQGGANGQVIQTAERTGISVGQTTRNNAPSAPQKPTAGSTGGAVVPSVHGGAQTMQQRTSEARYTRRPSKQPAERSADQRTPHGESSHPGTAGTPGVIPAQPPSGEPRLGRNGLLSRTAASSDTRQHSPTRQESRGASATATPTRKGTASSQHPGPAGTAAGKPTVPQSRQTVRPSAPSAKNSAQPGKKAVSTTTATLKGGVTTDGNSKPSRKQRGNKHE